MKRFVAALGLVGLCATAWAGKDDVLYIGKFEAKGVAQDEAGAIENSACTAATQDGRFSVRCRDTNATVMQLRQAQMELGYAEGAQYKDDCGGKEGCAGAMAKGTDAKWVLGGTLAKVAEKQYLLTLIIVDPASNAQVNRVEEKVAGDLSAVVDRVPGVVRRVLTPSQPARPAPAAPAPATKK
ncbi:MAG: hypothetical protein HY904_12295 [Deltaproteobacteria bacterium]|nr:hypothetical protein [Deltaproteobacteria bacterium]